MRLIYRLLLIVTGVAMFGTATAGEQYRRDNAYIYADDTYYWYYYDYIRAYDDCYENPDGMGGAYITGGKRIYGWIAGVYVNEYESYYGLDKCPQAENFGQSKKQEFDISVNGVTVNADCSNQNTTHGSGTSQNKYPGQKPQNYNNTWSQHWTANQYDGSCVVTATNSDGTTDTYSYRNYSRQYERFQNSNN